MLRKIVAVWVSLAMLFGFVVIVDVITDITPTVNATTLYVNETGSGGAYTSIQDAINASSGGDTVFVYNGTYFENVVVNKTINLTGEDWCVTIIDGGGSGNSVWINADWVNITGFTITKGGAGTYLTSSNNNIIGNNISNNGYGIRLYSSSNSCIVDNNVSNNFYGFHLDSSSNNIITNNNIFSSDWVGIELESSSNNNITWNNVSLNIDYYGILLDSSSNNNLVISNNVSNNRWGIVVGSSSNNNITDNKVFSNSGEGIYLSGSSNNNITNNDLLDNLIGIYFQSSSYNNLIDNNISSNHQSGIQFYLSSSNNLIMSNDILANSAGGIVFSTSSNHILANNSIFNNEIFYGTYGIYLYSTIFQNISGNNFVNNGIYIKGDQLSHFNTHNIPTNNIVNNNPLYYFKDCNSINIDGLQIGQLILANCTEIDVKNLQINNTDVGIEIAYSSNLNITKNNVSNNDYGVMLFYSSDNRITTNDIISNTEWGLYLESSLNNRIYRNNFINNPLQAYEYMGDNFWNDTYPFGGNFWSDYWGVDNYKGPNQNILGSDGIGDTPYTNIQGSAAQDNYPLMQQYKPIENYTILKQGWNLISIPLIQEEQNLTRVLGSIDSWYDATQWYDITDTNNHWKHYKANKPFGNDLFELNETMGFWIHIIEPGDTIFLYNGTQPTENQSIPLHPGWNMVGYPSLTNHNRTVGLNTLEFGTDVDAIQWYDAATQTWHFMGPDDPFVPERGYWVHSKVEAEWEVPL